MLCKFIHSPATQTKHTIIFLFTKELDPPFVPSACRTGISRNRNCILHPRGTIFSLFPSERSASLSVSLFVCLERQQFVCFLLLLPPLFFHTSFSPPIHIYILPSTLACSLLPPPPPPPPPHLRQWSASLLSSKTHLAVPTT
ncbi:hypothetical protein K457DRAFT_326563 [Linnemannia elongata AG-77]|uniref:Uncharacterized protein n=1 Tax=Linnemannia elongata AG-77 TaxID=1314771 RepID=A0A197K3K2_9FUNG|nr:hypothetical protein K457DRAFT_326563 [Linnemannia elongata AG-77]